MVLLPLNLFYLLRIEMPFTTAFRHPIQIKGYLIFLCGAFRRSIFTFISLVLKFNKKNDWWRTHAYTPPRNWKRIYFFFICGIFSEMFSLFMCQIIEMPVILWVISEKKVNKNPFHCKLYTPILFMQIVHFILYAAPQLERDREKMINWQSTFDCYLQTHTVKFQYTFQFRWARNVSGVHVPLMKQSNTNFEFTFLTFDRQSLATKCKVFDRTVQFPYRSLYCL